MKTIPLTQEQIDQVQKACEQISWHNWETTITIEPKLNGELLFTMAGETGSEAHFVATPHKDGMWVFTNIIDPCDHTILPMTSPKAICGVLRL